MAEEILIQMGGSDLMLNSKGEWNVCSIPGLVLEDKEPDEEELSVKSKRKAKLQRLGSFSSGSRGKALTQRGDECKAEKKIKLTVPCIALTFSSKRT